MLVIYQKQFITVKMIVFCNNTSIFYINYTYTITATLLFKNVAAVNRGRRLFKMIHFFCGGK